MVVCDWFGGKKCFFYNVGDASRQGKFIRVAVS
jgi:hypothetical protein